ncbi:MAG: PadR family transcriptional regulator [Corynebacterium sp.]|nr:PadR family transcriptional regulator [Corynebacterium sp.]
MNESQLRKGALELIIVGLLSRTPTYGGDLLERLSDEAHLDISPGTVYPLLARLHKTGTLATHWEESPTGPPRKIYSVTTAGRHHHTDLLAEWDHLDAAIRATSPRKD